MPNVTVIPPNKATQNCSAHRSKPKKRVAGYARVSTEKDEQFVSYEAQIAYYTRYIESREDWEFAGMYTDEGLTGTNTRNRKGFNQMVQDALDGKLDLIVTKSVSRFARNTVDSLVAIRKLKAVGCECYFEKENIFTFDGKGELLLTIMSSLAQEESRSISANVTWGMQESMRRGNAYVPYSSFLGYDRGENGTMEINAEQAITVRRIYCMYLQGMSTGRIARILMDENVPSPTGRPRWFAQTVDSILKNEKYKGDALRQKTYTRDFLSKEKLTNTGELQQYYISEHHEAIIPQRIFSLVQEAMREEKPEQEPCRGRYPLSQRVKCGSCGLCYGPKTWNDTSEVRTVWACNGKYKKNRCACSAPRFTEAELKGFFISALNKLLGDRARLEALLEWISRHSVSTRGYELEAELLAHELTEVSARLASTPEDTPKAERFISRLSAARERLLAVEGALAQCEREKAELDAFLEKLRQLSTPVTRFDEEIWYTLADGMTVYGKDDVRIRLRDGGEIEA